MPYIIDYTHFFFLSMNFKANFTDMEMGRTLWPRFHINAQSQFFFKYFYLTNVENETYYTLWCAHFEPQFLYFPPDTEPFHLMSHMATFWEKHFTSSFAYIMIPLKLNTKSCHSLHVNQFTDHILS